METEPELDTNCADVARKLAQFVCSKNACGYIENGENCKIGSFKKVGFQNSSYFSCFCCCCCCSVSTSVSQKPDKIQE